MDPPDDEVDAPAKIPISEPLPSALPPFNNTEPEMPFDSLTSSVTPPLFPPFPEVMNTSPERVTPSPDLKCSPPEATFPCPLNIFTSPPLAVILDPLETLISPPEFTAFPALRVIPLLESKD